MDHATTDLCIPVNIPAHLTDPAPVERWNPSLTGVLDLCIARDGTWYHEGRIIHREALVRLFARVLRREEDGHHYLVTPVEKWRIRVELAPFRAVRLDIEGHGRDQSLHFTTNLGDTVIADSAHPLQVEYPVPDGDPVPLLLVRSRLQALLTRAVFLELATLGEAGEEGHFGVWSRGCFFSLGRLDDSD